MTPAEEIYEIKCNDNSDICQHMPILREYASRCETVIELGVRSIVSTWAFLLGQPKIMYSVDIKHPHEYRDHNPVGCDLDLVYSEARRLGVIYEFILGDSITTALPSCDLMFFDTLHTYSHLSAELAAHGNFVKKYMIFHDTSTYEHELMPAITQWLMRNKEWSLDQRFYNNNGLTILKHA